MKKYQFYHNVVGKCTAMLNPPSKQALIDFVNVSLTDTQATLKLEYGLALLHPNDNYVKSIGRDISLKNSKVGLFRIHNINYFKGGYKILLINEYCHEIILHIKLNRPTVYFIAFYR
jgi:hypothetical protein